VTRVIKAAGGLVLRVTPRVGIEVLIAHRPSYDDWALPKGKLDLGESPEEAAVREVLEETGYHCRVVARLPTTRHKVNSGIKEVHWFAMRPLPDSPGFEKNAEIDRIQWASPRRARKVVDYANDRKLIEDSDLDGLTSTGTLWLVRHALAGDREQWKGKDRRRPLTKKGKRQAAAIASRLTGAEVDRVVSSPFLRCVDTVAPLAKAIGAEVENDDRLAEGAESNEVLELIDSLAGFNAVLCTHGDVAALVLRLIEKKGAKLKSKPYSSKGSIWEIEVVGGKYTKAGYTPPPR
jgi:8-oxo-(d)GTP phosphatase